MIILLLSGGLLAYGFARSPSKVPPLPLAASAKSRPHVFVVLIDTLRADHLEPYGYPKPTSPNLSELALDSTTYTRPFAQAPWTRPSCASLLTSRYPPEIGVLKLAHPLPERFPILPQFMKAEGYATAGIISSVQLSPAFGFDKGFDLMDVGKTYLRWTGTEVSLERLRIIKDRGSYPRYNARELTDKALRWLGDGAASSGEPHFAYLHYSDPHQPYQPPAGDDRWRRFAIEAASAIKEPPIYPKPRDDDFDETMRQALVARYDAEIAFFDQEFGRFLDYLTKNQLYDDSLIIVTADHGEEFEEHGAWGHAHSLYNELLHVPLIVKYPRSVDQHSERRVDRPVSLVDVLPTIESILGADWQEESFRGRSLLELANGEAEPERAIYADNADPELRALYYKDHKLIQFLDGDGFAYGERYYSLENDFGERGDGDIPADADPADIDFMRAALQGIGSAKIGAEEVDLDDETKKELEALGYL